MEANNIFGHIYPFMHISLSLICLFCLGTNNYNEPNGSNKNAPNIFIREYMDLDEFFAVTTAVTWDVKTRSCEDIDHSFLLNTDSGGNSRLRASDELVNESQMQEVLQISAEGCDEQANDRIANADGCTTRNTIQQQQKSGRKSSQLSANISRGKDNTYWDRRVKNNIAAKRSRDAKRTKEVNVVERWNFLEEENKRLKKQIANMKERMCELESGEGIT